LGTEPESSSYPLELGYGYCPQEFPRETYLEMSVFALTQVFQLHRLEIEPVAVGWGVGGGFLDLQTQSAPWTCHPLLSGLGVRIGMDGAFVYKTLV
jgi:hypothetical protein